MAGELFFKGYNCAQVFALLEQKGICKAADLEAWAANGELDDYWFLEDVERGDKYCLEGFLFPDTYDFYKNSSPRDVLEKLLDMQRRGEPINRGRIRYAIDIAKDGNAELIKEIMGDVVALTNRGKQIKCKTLGQKKYIDAISHNNPFPSLQLC